MKNIFINLLRGIKKRWLQYLSIIMLLIIIIATLSGLYSTVSRFESGFYKVRNNSGKYDYRINLQLLNNYKNISNSTLKIQEIIKNQFKDHKQKNTINKQILQIKENNLRNNSFPLLSSGSIIHKDFEKYLLDWGLSYQGILFNDILNQEIYKKNINNFQYYKITKSFFKTFDYINFIFSKKIYYSLENGFCTLKNNNTFDFSPSRNNINEIYISKGVKPNNELEICINPDFAFINNIKLNDYLTIINQTKKLKIVGFGYAYWGITGSRTATNPNPTSANTNPIYMSNEYFNNLIKNFSFRTNLNNIFLLKVKNKDSFFINKLEETLIKTFNFNFGSIISNDTEDIRSGKFLEIFKMENIIFISITFVVTLIVIFIIMSYIRKEINLQKTQIGLLKAMGYNNFQINICFSILIFLIIFISDIIGLNIGLGLQILFNSFNNIGFFMPLPILFLSSIVLIVTLLIIPIIFIIISYIQSEIKLYVNPLLLIYEISNNSFSKVISFLKYFFHFSSFKKRIKIAFALKSIGKLFLIFFTFIFVTFLLIFQSSSTDLFDNKINNLYGYYNENVKWNRFTSSMYTYVNDKNLKIKNQIFDWISEKDIKKFKNEDNKKYHEWIANSFCINDLKKLIKIQNIIKNNDFKNHFINSKEINILYQKTKNKLDFEKFINPINLISKSLTDTIYVNFHKLFNYILINTGIDPKINLLPGISLGLNIYNNNYYPTIELNLKNPNSWKEHIQGPMLAKKIQVTGIYNDINQDLFWKKWFNFQETKNINIDNILNNSHKLKIKNIIYTDNQNQIKNYKSYILPSVISKSLSILNNYKINDKFLMLANWYNFTIPVIFQVYGIIENNLDNSNIYTNINDLRKSIGLIDKNTNLPILNSFNYWLSKKSNIFPLNYINISQPHSDYSKEQILAKNLELINKTPFINYLIKKLFIEIFSGIRKILNITKFLTLLAVFFVLIIIVNMILDNNLLIIIIMKSFGYRINEINKIIIGSYIFILLFAFILGVIISYLIWNAITLIIATKSGFVFNILPNLFTILTCFSMVFIIMIISYNIGLFLIKNKPVTNLFQ